MSSLVSEATCRASMARFSFLPDVPHCIDDHPVEVSAPLPWDFGSYFFPPRLDVYWLDLRLY
jgi:hypothetical protein